jgi:hypothetical protein
MGFNSGFKGLKQLLNVSGLAKISILTIVTLARSNNALPDDGVTASKHVGAVLM